MSWRTVFRGVILLMLVVHCASAAADPADDDDDGPPNPYGKRKFTDPARIQKPLRRLDGHTDTARCVALSADKKKLVTGGNDRTVRLWDFETGKVIRIFEGHTGFVAGVDISADGRRIISSAEDQTIRVWDAGSGEQVGQLEGHQGQLIAASFLSDPNFAVSASHDGTARLWDISKEATIHRFDHDRQVCSMAVCLEKDLLATGTHNGKVHLWDLKTRKQLREFEALEGCIQQLMISTDGKKMVIVPAEAQFRVVDTATGAKLFEQAEKEKRKVWNAALSGDGQYVALGCGFEVVFYNLKSGQPCKTFLQNPTFNTQAMCFVPDSDQLVTVGGGYLTKADHWMRLWDASMLVWKLPQPLP